MPKYFALGFVKTEKDRLSPYYVLKSRFCAWTIDLTVFYVLFLALQATPLRFFRDSCFVDLQKPLIFSLCADV